MNLPPFFIGQAVVAIFDATNSSGSITIDEGEEYQVKRLKKGCCEWLVDVGLRYNTPKTITCCKNGIVERNTRIVWISHKVFAPIETTFQEITFSKVIEKEKCHVN